MLWLSPAVRSCGCSTPLTSTAGCGKPHVRWCGREQGRNPLPPTRSLQTNKDLVAQRGFAANTKCSDRSDRRFLGSLPVARQTTKTDRLPHAGEESSRRAKKQRFSGVAIVAQAPAQEKHPCLCGLR